ncbi:Acyl-coenzyme A thioesterase PaaI [Sporomusa silvacetica DSM 10669]|uniref:Acyl-coenzyme A thioesterase PaaI n=1 Tax=Sporomusa silvacetica DSM 10669 TaxID=1123289 RepID=A0ABZ3IV65_9FIRM|nr:PaaI family thioesterase [Sporomusa silvacetica]OZC14261.1 acyl-coenzyme A thioesterase PaaI [Sporomusa silvacetica DSM 10669]
MEIWLKNRIEEIFKDNPLSSMMDIHISALDVGEVTLTMPIASEIHTNVYGFVHGGSLFTLVDSVMGIAGLTTGNLVVTSDINIRFITNSKKGNMLTASGRIIHKGKDTIITEAEIRDKRQRLLVKAQGSYFIRGQIKAAVPAQQNDGQP